MSAFKKNNFLPLSASSFPSQVHCQLLINCHSTGLLQCVFYVYGRQFTTGKEAFSRENGRKANLLLLGLHEQRYRVQP